MTPTPEQINTALSQELSAAIDRAVGLRVENVMLRGDVAALQAKLAEAAKVLGTGQNRLFDLLRAWRWLLPSGYENLPYQEHVDNGHLVVRTRHYEDQHGADRTYSKTLVTGKGLVDIRRRMASCSPASLIRPQHSL